MSDLVVEHLEVRYGDLIGVADVSLRIKRGQIVALLGSNGAGKTTTLNAIAGLVKASKGRIEWRGEMDLRAACLSNCEQGARALARGLAPFCVSDSRAKFATGCDRAGRSGSHRSFV